MVSFSARSGADHEGITALSPKEVDAEDRDANEQSEEDEVVDRHVAAVAGVFSLAVIVEIRPALPSKEHSM